MGECSIYDMIIVYIVSYKVRYEFGKWRMLMTQNITQLKTDNYQFPILPVCNIRSTIGKVLKMLFKYNFSIIVN